MIETATDGATSEIYTISDNDKSSTRLEPYNFRQSLCGDEFREAWLRRAEEHLSRIVYPEKAKKRNTIIALVDARLAGLPDASVFEMSDTCSRNTWYDKWSKDQLIRDVLDAVESLAFTLKDRRKLEALATAKETITMASPAAAQTLAAMAAFGYMDTMLNGDTLRVPVAATERLRAALGLLDRASSETAAKNAIEHTGADGGKIEHNHSGAVTFYIPDNGRDTTATEARDVPVDPG